MRDEARELRVMAVEDTLSAEREKQDKIELEARLRKQPKRPNAAKPKANTLGQVASPKSRSTAQMFSSERRSLPADCPANHYLSGFEQLFVRFESYRERLDCQKDLLRTYTDFKNQVSHRFKQLVD